MRRGKPPLKRTQEGLHFIISNPSSNDGKAKDLHVVRSHVGRWTWQKVRKQQEEIQARTENKEVNSVPVAGSDTSEDEDENLESEFSALGSVSSSSSSSSTSYIVHNDGDDEVGQTVRLKPMSNFKPDRSSQEHSNLPSPSPIRSICASILDPFQTHVSSPISTDLVSMSNKYCMLNRIRSSQRPVFWY